MNKNKIARLSNSLLMLYVVRSCIAILIIFYIIILLLAYMFISLQGSFTGIQQVMIEQISFELDMSKVWSFTALLAAYAAVWMFERFLTQKLALVSKQHEVKP